MKKYLKFMIIIVILLAVCGLSSCAKKATFSDIEITGNNVTNVEEGTYTLRYNIKNLVQYEKKTEVDINVIVTDSENQQINVINKRIIQIEADNEYLVTILVSANNGNDIKTHNYTIVAVKNPVTVTFSAGTYNNFDSIVKTVEYGGDLTDVPQVPEYTPTPITGYVITVTNSQWTRTDFDNLTQNITVYAEYQTSSTLASYTLIYDTNGGSMIAPETVFYGSSLVEPAIPTKDGYVFFGWYKDADFEENFTFGIMGTSDLTVYVRWLEPIANATSESFFDFEMNNQGWYTISAKDIANMPETVIIPNVYNNLPVTKIATSGFAKCAQIRSITIPSSINEIGVFAFSGKKPTENAVEMMLETVIFGETDKLLNIASNCFSYNNSLVSINIPNSVKAIDMQAFAYCSMLSDVDFSDESELLHIRDEAFLGCTSLVNIELPESLERFSPKAFYGCIMLESVIINSDYPPLLEEYDGYVFGYDDGEISRRLDVTIYVQSDILNMYQAILNYSAYNLQSISS